MNVIIDNELDVEAFKFIYKTLTWTKLPRNLGINHSEFFYSGLLNNEEKELKILLRSTLTMSVTESFKNRLPMNGDIPPDGYKGQLVDWGFYLEVQVPQEMFDEIASISQPLVSKKVKKIEW